MRGTKLTAERMPPNWKTMQENVLDVPEGSFVPQRQEKMVRATLAVLNAIAVDVSGGLLETVGIESSLSIGEDGRCSMCLALPEGTDTESVALAIDAENVESWVDELSKVHVAINPWYSTKDVDQTVLSATKIVHVMLGIHAADTAPPKTLTQKLLTSIAEIMQIQKGVEGKRE